MSIDSNDIVIVGNSITEYFDWAEYFKDGRIKNRGIGSDVIRGVINRNETFGKPSKLLMKIGINDIHKGRSVNEIISDYKDLLTQIKANTPLTKIYVISILPTEGSRIKLNEKVVAVNKELMALTKSLDLTYLDLHSLLLDSEQKLAPSYSIDGVHLSGEGYIKICAALATVIRDPITQEL